MGKVTDKYMDYNQFHKNKNGSISWRKSIGIIAEFFYYGKRHTVEILNYGNPSKDYIEIKIDDMTPEIVNTQKIRNLSFDDLFYEPNYLYNVGDIVNGSIILERLHIRECGGKGSRKKHYKCRCLTDSYEYIIREHELKSGHRCAVCMNKAVLIGCNDLATTDPDVVKFLLDKEDGCKYTRCSSKYVWAVCPHCEYKKFMKVEDLVLSGFSCKRCSDGLSYPNKFAYNVFMQIEDQYEEYESEYSPDWIKPKRYDNCILLKNGERIIVEMDGAFHRNIYDDTYAKSDAFKDDLAKKHGIRVIRVDCFYNSIPQRFEIVKNNFIECLQDYFDLSCVDWESANNAGISNRLIEAVNYYNNHPFASNQQIADYFHVRVETIRHYLAVGEKIGLCTYIRADPNRLKTSMPLALYDSNHNIIDTFISARYMAETMQENNFNSTSINEAARFNRPYKGYIVERITWEEHELFQSRKQICAFK